MSRVHHPVRLAAAGIALITTATLVLTGCASGTRAASAGGPPPSTPRPRRAWPTSAPLKTSRRPRSPRASSTSSRCPRDWANYGEILDLFAERYPEITIDEQSPDVSSAEEIQAAETNAGLDTAPDVFDLGLTVALQNTDVFAPYQVADMGRHPRRAQGAHRACSSATTAGTCRSATTRRSSTPRRRSTTCSTPPTRRPWRSTATRPRRARLSRRSASRPCRATARSTTSSPASTSSRS